MVLFSFANRDDKNVEPIFVQCFFYYLFFYYLVTFTIWMTVRRVFKSLLPMRGRSSWKVFQLKRGNENGRVRTKTESRFFKKIKKNLWIRLMLSEKILKKKRKSFFSRKRQTCNEWFPPIVEQNADLTWKLVAYLFSEQLIQMIANMQGDHFYRNNSCKERKCFPQLKNKHSKCCLYSS